MSRRVVVILLAGVIAAAVAIPALAASGGGSAKSASVKGLSVRALAKAKASLRAARAAKRGAHRAATAASEARDAAAAAQGSATAAELSAGAANGSAANASKQATLADEKAGGANLKAEEAKEAVAATKTHLDVAEGSVSTESETFVKLADGPVVTLPVAGSGLVQVWAGAEVNDGGAVSLYEDGQQVVGQAKCLGGESDADGVLFASPGGGAGGEEPLLLGTPATLDLCSTLGAPGPVIFQSSPGSHTFELRYSAACSCSGTATFSERRLVVQPLP